MMLPSSSETVYDTLSIGFGPASVALAIALVEHNADAPSPSSSTRPAVYSALGGLQDALGYDAHADAEQRFAGSAHRDEKGNSAGTTPRPVKACFIERYNGFKWHPGMMLPGSKMQISFLKDLATLRNPQSGYTFLAYLASFRPSRLVSFISLSTFNPSRREFADYLQWCANKVAGEIRFQGGDVAFGEDVVAVDALRPDEHDEGTDVKILRVTSRRIETGETIVRFTRNLVVSAGGSPKFPAELSTPELVASQRVVHTANFLERIDPVLDRIVSTASQQPLNRPLRLAVIGAGQSAAECFLHLRSKLAPLLPTSHKLERPQVDLLIRSSALRNTDESQFINEVFDPSMSQAVFRLGEEERTRVLGEAKNTNYSIVNPRTLEAVYETMYDQKIEEDIAARSATGAEDLALDPRLKIRPYTEVQEAVVGESGALSLTLHNPITHETRQVEYDVVVCGTGYNRQAWRSILFPPAASNVAHEATENAEVIPLAEVFKAPRARVASPPPDLSLPDSAFSEPIRPTARRSPSSDGSSSASSRFDSPARFDSMSRHSAASDESASTAPTSPPSPRSIAEPKSVEPVEDKVPDFAVKENYRLDLPTRTAAGAHFKPTVWLQGSCEKTHGISDSLLSVLAVRSGEVVQSILQEAYFDDDDKRVAA